MHKQLSNDIGGECLQSRACAEGFRGELSGKAEVQPRAIISEIGGRERDAELLLI